MERIGDIIFDSSKWNAVYAYDANTGSMLWKFEPGIARSRIKRACCDIAQNIAIYAGKVVLPTLDQRLIALDAATGHKVWEVTACDELSGGNAAEVATQTPKICIVERGSCSCSKRSHVTAYNINTGVKMWRFYSASAGSTDEIIKDIVARPATMWRGAWWMHGGNGATRDSMAFDPSQNLLYVYRHGFSITHKLFPLKADSDL